MSNRSKLVRLFVVLLAAMLLLSSCAASALETASKKKKNTAKPTEAAVTAAPEATATPGPMDEAQELVDYLEENGKLPDNFVTKKEAEEMGWKTKYRYVGDIFDGCTIGGVFFGNYEGQLPVVKGRKYYEADCFYRGRERNEYRLIYSNDGHYWFTGDHYETFTELFPSGQSGRDNQ